ncbi:MAG: hypothetical protein JSS42_05755 [Proteobacteria bacterium]|nr:hypothetical protein [Pseudomonadota bacterium]
MDIKKISGVIFTAIVAPVLVYWITVKPPPPPPPPLAPMGPLERGWNYAHNDLDAGKWLPAASAEACSDMCFVRADCRAMTYVISNRSCWLKFATTNKESNPDMISAERQP